MQHEENWPVGEHFVDVEQEPMHAILENGPDEVSGKKTQEGLDKRMGWDV